MKEALIWNCTGVKMDDIFAPVLFIYAGGYLGEKCEDKKSAGGQMTAPCFLEFINGTRRLVGFLS